MNTINIHKVKQMAPNPLPACGQSQLGHISRYSLSQIPEAGLHSNPPHNHKESVPHPYKGLASISQLAKSSSSSAPVTHCHAATGEM